MSASQAVFAQPKSDVKRSSEGMEFVSCDLCGMDDTKLMFYARDTLLGGSERSAVVRCQNCGLAYLNPRPTRLAIGKYYPADYYDYLGNSGIANTSRRKALKNLLYHLTEGIVGQNRELASWNCAGRGLWGRALYGVLPRSGMGRLRR